MSCPVLSPALISSPLWLSLLCSLGTLTGLCALNLLSHIIFFRLMFSVNDSGPAFKWPSWLSQFKALHQFRPYGASSDLICFLLWWRYLFCLSCRIVSGVESGSLSIIRLFVDLTVIFSKVSWNLDCFPAPGAQTLSSLFFSCFLNSSHPPVAGGDLFYHLRSLTRTH